MSHLHRPPVAPMLTPEQAAHRLGLLVDVLTELRRVGRGPDYLQLDDDTIRYSPAALSQWYQPTLWDRSDRDSDGSDRDSDGSDRDSDGSDQSDGSVGLNGPADGDGDHAQDGER